jgi:quinol monooxygenase YgiN
MSANEAYELRPSVPIVRVFRARARRGCERALADKLATSSVEVVQGQPGFLGYLAGGQANESQREFIFASIWADAEAIKACFGKEWRVSLLPPGYTELVEECSVNHYHLTGQSLVASAFGT